MRYSGGTGGGGLGGGGPLGGGQIGGKRQPRRRLGQQDKKRDTV